MYYGLKKFPIKWSGTTTARERFLILSLAVGTLFQDNTLGDRNHNILMLYALLTVFTHGHHIQKTK